MYNGYILRQNLPDRASLVTFTEQLFDYLFPVVENESDYLVQQEQKTETLKTILIELIQNLSVNNSITATETANNIFSALPATTKNLITDAQFILDYDPAANSIEEIILSYPGFYAIAIYRLAHLLYILQYRKE